MEEKEAVQRFILIYLLLCSFFINLFFIYHFINNEAIDIDLSYNFTRLSLFKEKQKEEYPITIKYENCNKTNTSNILLCERTECQKNECQTYPFYVDKKYIK